MEGEDEPLVHNAQPSCCSPKRWRIFCILLSQCLERMGYYGLVINVVLFLNIAPYGWSAYNAVVIILVSHCVSYFLSLIGALVSDVYLGKFKVIVIAYILYSFSFLMPFMYLDTWDGSKQMNVSDMCLISRKIDPYKPPKPRLTNLMHSKDRRNYFEESCAFIFTLSLLMTCSGNAFLKAVITPFGADQVKDEGSIFSLQSFMHWYYLSVNVGVLIAYIGTGYIEVNISIFWGYLCSCIMLTLSFIIMALGRVCFRVNPPDNHDLSLRELAGILFACCKPNRGNNNNQQMGNVGPKCLNKAKRENGGNFPWNSVEDVKRLLHILLIFLTFIFYWACYYQTESYFSSQGLHMKVPKFDNSLLPVTWLTGFNSLIIMILIPVINNILYPFLEDHHICPSLYTRMLIGMILSIFTMVVAGIVERQRMITFWGKGNPSANNPWNFVIQDIGRTQYYAANMTIFYLVPQYVLSGTAEVFIVVAGLEFAYRYAPKDMTSLVTGLFWCCSGLGSLLGMAVLQLVKGQFIFSSDRFDINYRKPCVVNGKKVDRWCKESRLDIYYYILAGLQLFGLILFLVIVKCILPSCRAFTYEPGRDDLEVSETSEEAHRQINNSGESLMQIAGEHGN